MNSNKIFCRFLLFTLIIPVYGFGSPGHVDSLQQQLEIAKSDSAKIDIMLALADRKVKLSCDEKLSYGKKALQIAQKNDNLNTTLEAFQSIGTTYSLCFKDHSTAISWHKEFLDYSQKVNSTEGKRIAYTALANNHNMLSEYDSSIYYRNKVLGLDISNENKIQAFGDIGVCYKTVGNYTAAIDNYQKAYNLLYQDMVTSKKPQYEDTLTLMGLQYEIGTIYKHIQDYDRALEQLEHVNELNKTIDFSWFHVLVNMEMGDCYFSIGDINKAISYYKLSKEAIGIKSYNNAEADLAQVLIRLSAAYYELKKIDIAYKYAIEAKTIVEGRNGHPKITSLLSKTYKTLGDVYASKREYEQGEAYLQKAVQFSAGASDQKSEALKSLSETYKKMGRHDAALKIYEEHIKIRDSLYSRTKMQQLTRIDMQGNFDRQQFADSLTQAKEIARSEFKLQRQRILTYSGFAGLALLLLLSFIVYRSYRQEKRANLIISEANKTIKEEKQVSENLLLNILPEEVADELKKEGKVVAQQFDEVSVLFTDFVNFTRVGEQLSPNELVEELHNCFKAFDEITNKYNIEKIKTIGDAYLAVAGLPVPNPHHAEDVLNAALEIQQFITNRKALLKEKTFDIRIGVHSGTVVAGIVGVKKFAYDIWGDTVNIAARMEQSSEPGRINISEHTHQLITDRFDCTYRGEIAAKNKGMLRMYFVNKKT